MSDTETLLRLEAEWSARARAMAAELQAKGERPELVAEAMLHAAAALIAERAGAIETARALYVASMALYRQLEPKAAAVPVAQHH